MMILDKYEYKYALVPVEIARGIGLGWRKKNDDGMVMLNYSELKQLPGTGSVEERVTAAGGVIFHPEEASMFATINKFTISKFPDDNSTDKSGSKEEGVVNDKQSDEVNQLKTIKKE